jgi:hypothetical protein
MYVIRGPAYVPIGDEASILFWIRQVGTLQTPLVGVYSTRQWAHPGPILYYLLAGPFRLLGSHPNGMYMGAVAVNLLSLLLSVYLLFRRRSGAQFVVAAALIAVLFWGLGAPVLVEAWNPDLPLFPYLPLVVGGIGTVLALTLHAERPSLAKLWAVLRSRPTLLAVGVTAWRARRLQAARRIGRQPAAPLRPAGRHLSGCRWLTDCPIADWRGAASFPRVS